MVEVKGLMFDDCHQKAVYFEEGGLTIRTIFINDLIDAKKASGRAKNINDLENLIP